VTVVTEVRAEITANVWQVPASVGDEVTEGQELAILESMKMEIPVESPCAGTVTAVHIAPDAQVKEGDLLFEIGS
jgi:acetyl-CoA carboxylase biotin carboxyl carrier protein